MLFVTGCAAPKMSFTADSLKQPAFYRQVLSGPCSGSPVAVYRTSFRDRNIITGDILCIAPLNDETMRDTVTDIPSPEGYRQDLYLVRCTAADCPDAWYYLSVWYRLGQAKPYAFGNAYYGFSDADRQNIYFNRSLKVKSRADTSYLVKGAAVNFHFVLSAATDSVIRVSRIVKMEDNKIGGNAAFVFNIAEHFPGDLNTINFRIVH